jgi:flagellar capping protein FliD
MATTRNQDLQASITQTKESINQVTSQIASANSQIEKLETHVQQQFDAMEAKFMGQFSTLQSIVNKLLNHPRALPSRTNHPT